MKVILTKDVKNLGRALDMVTAADGYALNFLIPKKLAIIATSVAQQHAEMMRKQSHDRTALDTALLTQNIASLADAKVTLTMKANDKGHLYDAVGASDISLAVKTQTHIDLPVDAIKLEKPIKELGTFTIPVSIGETFGSFPLTVAAE